MKAGSPLPVAGSIHLDTRGGGRVLRVRWHHEDELVVLSLWRENVCVGTFRLEVHEVPELIESLRAGLDAAYERAASGRRTTGEPAAG